MRPTVWKAFGRSPRYTALKEAFGFYVLPRSLFRVKACVTIENRACELFGKNLQGCHEKIRLLKAEDILCSSQIENLKKYMYGKSVIFRNSKGNGKRSCMPKYLNNIFYI